MLRLVQGKGGERPQPISFACARRLRKARRRSVQSIREHLKQSFLYLVPGSTCLHGQGRENVPRVFATKASYKIFPGGCLEPACPLPTYCYIRFQRCPFDIRQPRQFFGRTMEEG